MNENTNQTRQTKEAPWDVFRDEAGLSAESHAMRRVYEEDIPDADRQEQNPAVQQKLNELHAFLCTLYGNVVPNEQNFASSSKKMRSVEYYIARTIKELTLSERAAACKIAPNMQGVWMKTILEVIQMDLDGKGIWHRRKRKTLTAHPTV